LIVTDRIENNIISKKIDYRRTKEALERGDKRI